MIKFANDLKSEFFKAKLHNELVLTGLAECPIFKLHGIFRYRIILQSKKHGNSTLSRKSNGKA